jgi:ankyrin repeat protein
MTDKNMFIDLSEAVYVASTVKDNLEVIKYLLENGANPNYVKNGGSPLWYSCEQGDVQMAKLLVNHGMDVNIKGTSTFLLCVYSNNISGSHDVLEYLIDQDLELDLNKSKLLIAVTYSRYDLIKLLVEEEKLTSQQISELILIICKVMNSSHVFYCNLQVKPNQKIGNSLICDLLETSGVNINYQDKLGRTILIEACINKNLHLIKLLVLKGADTEIKDNDNYTAKDYLNKKMHHLVK